MTLNIFKTERFIREEEKQGDIPKFGNISKYVLKIVIPAMIESILVSLAVIIDSIMVSELGNAANAAVSITKQPIYFMICFITALNIAITTIIARRRGEGKLDSANKAMHTGIKACFFIAIILTIFMGFLSRPVCLLMGAKEDTIEFASTYLKIIAFGFMFNALRLTINAAQRGMGNTFISMVTNVTANFANVFLNYCLISGRLGFPALGIAGAAYATVIGNIVALFMALSTIIFNKEGLSFNFKYLITKDKESSKAVLNIFPSVMIEQAFMRIGFILFALIVNYLGTEAVFVHGICGDVNMILFAISDGFAIGTCAIVGHRLGEKRKDLAIVYARVSIMLAVVVNIAFISIMFITKRDIINLYSPNGQHLVDMAVSILYLAGFMAIPQTIQWNLTGILRGAGDTKFTATTSMISLMIIRPIISFVLCYLTPLALYGAWLGMLIDQLIRCSANIWRFKSRRWIAIDV